MKEQDEEEEKRQRSWGPLTIKWKVSSDPQNVLVKFLLDDELIDVSELNASQPDYSFDVCLGNSKACGALSVQFPTELDSSPPNISLDVRLGNSKAYGLGDVQFSISDISTGVVGKLSGQIQYCSRESDEEEWKCKCHKGIITWWE